MKVLITKFETVTKYQDEKIERLMEENSKLKDEIVFIKEKNTSHKNYSQVYSKNVQTESMVNTEQN